MKRRYDTCVPLRAVFLDIGDTLVEGWSPRERLNELMREALVREFGEREWYDAFVRAEFGAAEGVEAHRQETNRWLEEWFTNSGYDLDDVAVDRLRSTGSVPLDLVARLVPGAVDALRWSKSSGLVIGLVTNTLWRGDEEVWEDLRRFGLHDLVDHVVSSHSVGWQKPHEAIFRRALELSKSPAAEAVMVGDRMMQDVWGAKRLGMRAIWRRPLAGDQQEAVDVEPDAVIDDLTELPALLERWM
jgi:putative hydrolase of the HAD superfamily